MLTKMRHLVDLRQESGLLRRGGLENPYIVSRPNPEWLNRAIFDFAQNLAGRCYSAAIYQCIEVVPKSDKHRPIVVPEKMRQRAIIKNEAHAADPARNRLSRPLMLLGFISRYEANWLSSMRFW